MNPNLSKIQLYSVSKASFKNTILYLLGGFCALFFTPLNYLWLIIIAEVIFALLFLFSCAAIIGEFSDAKSYYNLLLNDPILTTYELALKLKTANSNGKETEEELKNSAKDEECNIREFIIKCEQKGFLLPGVYFDLEAGRLVFPSQQQAPPERNGHEPNREYSQAVAADLTNKNSSVLPEAKHQEYIQSMQQPVENSPLSADAPDAQNVGVIYCGQCGAKTTSANKFCSQCGSVLNQ